MIRLQRIDGNAGESRRADRFALVATSTGRFSQL
jgi:hypothetical protein